MTTQNLTITNLMSELVKREGSDFILQVIRYPTFRIQGSIFQQATIFIKKKFNFRFKSHFGCTKIKPIL